MSSIERIAILTGGGDCPGLNALIRAVTRAAILKYGLSVVGIKDGFGGLVRDECMELDEEAVSGILPKGGTILGTTNREDPFRYPVLTESGEYEYKDRSDLAVENLEKTGAEVLVVAGGDGSLSIALELCGKGVPVVGVPKTIDNDIMKTDVTFGFQTAVNTATEGIDKLRTTAESHHRAMVLEVMGRDTGWIALASGVAGGCNIILIPEISFTYENIADSLLHRRAKGKHFSIIIVAEGARLPDGEAVTRLTPSGHEVYGGVGERIAREVEDRTDIETRVTVLGHLQRGGTPTPDDRLLATELGVKAVEMAVAGEFGRMASVRGYSVESVELADAVSNKRLVKPDSQLVDFARSIGVSFGDG